MKANRKVKRAARQLFRLCLVNGALDEGRARQVAQRIAASRRRGALAILSDFQRLVRLDCDRHTALVESATPLASGMREGIPAGLTRVYGPGLEATFERIQRSSAGCGSKSAAMCTTTACGPAWRRSRHVCDVMWSEMTYG